MSSGKRLSLEERLALASKKGKKRGKKQLSASPAPAETHAEKTIDESVKEESAVAVPEAVAQPEPVADAPETAEKTVEVVKDDSPSKQEETVETKVAEPVVAEPIVVEPTANEPTTDKTESAKSSTTTASADEPAMESEPTPTITSPPVVSSNDPEEQMVEVAASTKEQPQPALKLSNLKQEWLPENYQTIPVNSLLNLLDAHIKELTDVKKGKNDKEREELQKKDELITQLRKEGENLAKTDLKRSNQIKLLKSKVFDLEKDISHIQEEYTEVCDNNSILESNLRELQKVIASSDATIKEQKTKITDIEVLQKDIKSRDEEVERLTRELSASNDALESSKSAYENEMKTLRETTSTQINNLETEVEQLKIELENAEHLHDQTGSVTQSDSGSQQLAILEQQLKSSKENWASIEESLNTKVVHLDETIQADKRLLQASEEKVKHLEIENKTLQERLKSDNLRISTMENQLKDIKSTLESTQHSYDEIKDDYKLLERKYNVQKQQLTKAYGEASSRENSPDSLLPNTNSKNQSLGPVSEEWLLPADDSLLSLQSVSTNIEGDKLTEMDVQTPSRDLEASMDIPDDAEHLQSLLNKTANSRSSLLLGVPASLKRSDSSLLQGNVTTFDRSNNTELQTSTITTNPQLVTRLGSEVRRLENELRNMQTSFDNLLAEKDSANEEILKLMENNDKVVSISNENKSLKDEVEQLSKRLEVSLQILGEKTETVEELENDVNDLKDMIKQQVQQMVEMQESKL
ncbi:Sgm1 protein [Maudiozyma humilis]|uniref:Sgm1 protein n=1 Tax=Maudiozyma humilis TaxID=51915 RepID=A0AAV5S123_MAUHU|nr:Sgm1 protein [Kazachstania humilis]